LHKQERPVFPFTAIVGQEKMKQALLLNVINPGMGGVLIRGEKGTAKSTAVRALSRLLPEINVVKNCPFGCDPGQPNKMCPYCHASWEEKPEALESTQKRIQVKDLPVGSTEDRVLGSLDLERAIKEGEKKFEPGILAEANRGILYVDEVNLLDDHIVDVLLDAAAMGVNTVEREGVSFSHPCEFVLVGTMNPEEGEIRPQLLDRFGLCVQVEGIADVEDRKTVVRRRMDFEQDPEAFFSSWQVHEQEISKDIQKASELLPKVTISEGELDRICGICIQMGVDGHRADITMLKAAKGLASLAGRIEVDKEDVFQAADMALPHRMRRKPFQDVDYDREKVQNLFEASK